MTPRAGGVVWMLVSVRCARAQLIRVSSRLHSQAIEQVVCEVSSWPAIRTGLYTHVYACTQLHARWAASTQGLGAGDGSTVEPHRLHSATATPFSTGTPLSRVALYTHSQHDSGPSTAPPQAEHTALFSAAQNHAHSSLTPPSAATTRTRRSWCRCDAEYTHGTRLWLAGVGASWRDRVGFRVAMSG
jgi:hypothetical protein